MISRRSLLRSTANASVAAAAGGIAIMATPVAAARPDAELLALGAEFDRLFASHPALVGAADEKAATFREAHPEHRRLRDAGEAANDAFWRDYTDFCRVEDDALRACCERVNEITERMHELPATTLAGFAAKARTLRFNVGTGEADRPMEEWDWDEECLERFIRDLERAASGRPSA